VQVVSSAVNPVTLGLLSHIADGQAIPPY
jgi:hypothetical protein